MKTGYISRKAVLNLLNEMGGCDATDEWAKGWDKAIDTVYNAVIELPAVKVEHGKQAATRMNGGGNGI